MLSKSFQTGLFTLFLFITQALGTQESVVMVPQPLDINGEIIIMDTPVLIGEASPETDFSAISLPYILKAISYREIEPIDINQASLAKVKITGSALSPDHYLITFDLAEAIPELINRSLFLQLIECCTRISYEYEVTTLSFELANTEKHLQAPSTLNAANIFYHRFHDDSETWIAPTEKGELELIEEPLNEAVQEPIQEIIGEDATP